MDAPIEPSEFDVIVVGTGLSESILAAACSLVGKKVLHLDASDFYGSHWGSLTPDTLLDWLRSNGNGTRASSTISSQRDDALTVRTTDGAEQPLPVNAMDTVSGSLDSHGILKTGKGAENVPHSEQPTEETVLTDDVETVGVKTLAHHDDGEIAGIKPLAHPNDALAHPDDGETPGIQTLAHPDAGENGRTETLAHSGDGATPGLETLACPDDFEIVQVETLAHPVYHGIASPELGQGLPRSKNYSLDLAGPRLSFCTGPMVDLIVKSGAHNYMEFKALEASYLWMPSEGRLGGGLMQVPSSRADVFQDRSLGLADKRALMRFFNLVNDYSTVSGGKVEPTSTQANGALTGGGLSHEELEIPFVELLRRQRLQDKIRSCILYAIALIEEDQEGGGEGLVKAHEGLETMVMYLNSMARFGQGAFLYPLYGQAELPQAFCRTAAVKGAIYVLRRPVTAVLLDKESRCYRGIQTATGQLLFSSTLIAGPGFRLPAAPPPGEPSAPPETPAAALQEEAGAVDKRAESRSGRQVARCVCVTDRSLVADRSIVLVIFPPRSLGPDQARAIRTVQLGSSLSVCTSDRFVVQLSVACDLDQEAESLLRPAVDTLFCRMSATSSASADTDTPADLKAGPVEASRDEARPAASEREWEGDGVSSSSGGGLEERGGSAEEGRGEAPSSTVGPPEMTTDARVSAEGERSEEETRPRLLWSSYFTQAAAVSQGTLPDNVIVGPMPDSSLDYRGVVASCSQTFAELYPGEEFFPPAPSVSSDAEEGDDAEESHTGTVEQAELKDDGAPRAEASTNGHVARPEEPEPETRGSLPSAEESERQGVSSSTGD